MKLTDWHYYGSIKPINWPLVFSYLAIWGICAIIIGSIIWEIR